MSNNHNSTSVTLPAFHVNGAEILTRKGSVALTGTVSALYALAELLDAHSNSIKPFENVYGLAVTIKSLAANLASAEDAIMPLEAANLHALLDAEQAKGAGNDDA